METPETGKTPSMAASPLKSTPLDFSQVTPVQFGISTQSFIPPCQGKDKSRLSQLKARRRSTVGVRGSPEMNSLIRFIAQQRSKSPPSTTLTVQSSPYPPRGFSSLKQKMASFQSVLKLDENQERELPKQEDREQLSYESSQGAVKENMDPQGCVVSVTPPLAKKPCMEVSPLFLPHDSLHVFGASGHVMQEETSKGQVDGWMLEAAELCSSALDHAICESPTEELQTWHTEPQSPTPDVLPLLNMTNISNDQPIARFSPAKCPASAHDLICVHDSTVGKKKRVRFGEPLPPEFFDKTLPPSTPLQKGGTPARLMSSGKEPALRSLLKTPQKAFPPIPQPDFNSPSLTSASPGLSRGLCSTENECDQVDLHRKILLMDEAEETASPPVNMAVGAALISCPEDIDQCGSQTVETSPLELQEPACHTEVPAVSEVSTQPVIKVAPPRPRGRKRKQPVENLETKPRASRAAAISASSKLKDSSSKNRWGHKEVDRSLYAKRNYASKNPALSPITEALSSASHSPSPQRGCNAHTFSEEDGSATVGMPKDAVGHSGSGAVAASLNWRKRFGLLSEGVEEYVTTTELLRVSEAQGDLAASKPGRSVKGKGRGRRSLRGKVRTSCSSTAGERVAEGQDEANSNVGVEQLCDQSSVKTQDEVPELPLGPDSQVNDMECNMNSSSSHCLGSPEEGAQFNCDPSGKETSSGVGCSSNSESHDKSCSEQAGDSPTPHSHLEPGGGQDTSVVEGVEVSNTKSKGLGRWKRRRSSRFLPGVAVADAEVHGEALEQHEAEELVRQGIPELAAGGVCAHELRSEISDMMAVGGAHMAEGEGLCAGLCAGAALLPWQQSDFCIDSIVQSLPKERRSVRRSLRQQSNGDPSLAGLVWVPCLSPDTHRPPCRRSKGCPAPVTSEQPGL